MPLSNLSCISLSGGTITMILLISSGGLGHTDRLTPLGCDIGLIAVSDFGLAPTQSRPLSQYPTSKMSVPCRVTRRANLIIRVLYASH